MSNTFIANFPIVVFYCKKHPTFLAYDVIPEKRPTPDIATGTRVLCGVTVMIKDNGVLHIVGNCLYDENKERTPFEFFSSNFSLEIVYGGKLKK